MSRGLEGTTRVVSDKSLTHRGVLLASVAGGRTVLQDPNEGADCLGTLRAVGALGAEVRREPGAWIIEGGFDRFHEPEDVIDLGNSGTGMRLLCGLLASRPFFSILTGDHSLRRRPMARVVEPLRRMGASIEARSGVRPPLAVRGGRLRGGKVVPEVASAQVKSALLLAALSLEEGSICVQEPIPSRDHTERLLAYLGASLRRDEGGISLDAGARLRARDWSVPGDISAAVFLLVGAAITPGSRVTVEHVGVNPTRTGALEVLQEMGARVEMEPEPVEGPEPVASLTVRSSILKPVTVGGSVIPRLIDEVPVLAVAAACAPGTSRFENVGELRHKESDRIASTCALLRVLGVEVEEEAEAFTVRGTGRLGGGRVESRDDHRIAMAAMIAGCASREEVTVDTLDMVATSDPDFLPRLARLRSGASS